MPVGRFVSLAGVTLTAQPSSAPQDKVHAMPFGAVTDGAGAPLAPDQWWSARDTTVGERVPYWLTSRVYGGRALEWAAATRPAVGTTTAPVTGAQLPAIDMKSGTIGAQGALSSLTYPGGCTIALAFGSQGATYTLATIGGRLLYMSGAASQKWGLVKRGSVNTGIFVTDSQVPQGSGTSNPPTVIIATLSADGSSDSLTVMRQGPSATVSGAPGTDGSSVFRLAGPDMTSTAAAMLMDCVIWPAIVPATTIRDVMLPAARTFYGMP